MKITKLLFLTMIFIFLSINIYAEKKFILYGYKLGQKIEPIIKELGKPTQIHKFPDGFVAYIYQNTNHNLILETDNTRPDLLWAIQIEGNSNPAEYGLEKINLGDSSDNVLSNFGKPDNIRYSIDEVTKKEIKDIEYYSYTKKNNFSFEIKNNKVSSIKIQFNGSAFSDSNDIYILDKFLDNVKKKNYYQIATYLAQDIEIHWNKESYKFGTSALKYLLTNKKINDIFFNLENGIASLLAKNIDKNITKFEGKGKTNNLNGFIFKIFQDNKKYEFIMVQSYEGWILKGIIY